MLNHHLQFTLFIGIAFSANNIASVSSLSASSPTGSCKIQVCHNKDCTKKGGGESLLNTFRDLLPNSCETTIESSGCLSQCGKGPNVMIQNNGKKEERMFFGVEDPTTASAVLDVAAGEEYPIHLLVAASSIYDAEHARSPAEKEKHLTSAISALVETKDPILLNSFAHARALTLRADARLDMKPANIEGAITDATLASEIKPNERKVWRVLASAHEAEGNIKEAINALGELAVVDASFSTKAKKEIKRLASL